MQPLQERAEDKQSLQGPTTFYSSENTKKQVGSTLSRAVERARDLYEKNDWVFLPLGEASNSSPINPQVQPKLLAKDNSIDHSPPPLVDEIQNLSKMSDEKIANLSKDLDQGRKEGTMSMVTSPVPEKRRQGPEKITSQDWERQEIEESIRNLRQLRTQKQRITSIQDLPPEYHDKLHHYDPEFIGPILEGLEKRSDRIEKAARLLYRIREGDMSGRKINYESLRLCGNILLSFQNHPDTWGGIPNKYEDSLIEAISDLYTQRAALHQSFSPSL